MKDSLLLWAPRLAGILVAAFLALFALDAFDGHDGNVVIGFLVHLLPSIGLALVVALSWRRPVVGALVFLALAVAYAITARRLDWIAVVGGPLVLASLLYFASWLRFRQRPLS